MSLMDHPWFPEERCRIGAIAPDAVFTDRGQVSLIADIAAGDLSTAFSLAAIYDEANGAITGIRTYPLVPSFEEVCAVVAPVLQRSEEEVQAMFPTDGTGNPMLPSGFAANGAAALASAAAFMTVLQQAVRHNSAEELTRLLETPDAWRRQLPPFGMRCFGQMIRGAAPAAPEAFAAPAMPEAAAVPAAPEASATSAMPEAAGVPVASEAPVMPRFCY